MVCVSQTNFDGQSVAKYSDQVSIRERNKTQGSCKQQKQQARKADTEIVQGRAWAMAKRLYTQGICTKAAEETREDAKQGGAGVCTVNRRQASPRLWHALNPAGPRFLLVAPALGERVQSVIPRLVEQRFSLSCGRLHGHNCCPDHAEAGDTAQAASKCERVRALWQHLGLG